MTAISSTARLPSALSRAAAAKPVMLAIIGRSAFGWRLVPLPRESGFGWKEYSPLQGAVECRQLKRRIISEGLHASAGESAVARRLRAERLSHRKAPVFRRGQQRLF